MAREHTWAAAIEEFFGGNKQPLAELCGSRASIPQFVRQFLADLVSDREARHRGRPVDRLLRTELSIVAAFDEHYARLRMMRQESKAEYERTYRKTDFVTDSTPRGIAFSLVAKARGMTPGQVRGVVARRRKKDLGAGIARQGSQARTKR